jgi:hypothetical protein
MRAARHCARHSRVSCANCPVCHSREDAGPGLTLCCRRNRIRSGGDVEVVPYSARFTSPGSDARAHSVRGLESWLLSSARARCRALFTDATLDSRRAAVSFADQPRRSRTTRTVRCLGGMCSIATRGASFATTTASSGPWFLGEAPSPGPNPLRECPHRPKGPSCSQTAGGKESQQAHADRGIGP